MPKDFNCAFCGESTGRADYKLKPPHLQKLMEDRDLRAPIFRYEIPACRECRPKAEALREDWVCDYERDVSQYLEEIQIEYLVDWNPHTNEPVE